MQFKTLENSITNQTLSHANCCHYFLVIVFFCDLYTEESYYICTYALVYMCKDARTVSLTPGWMMCDWGDRFPLYV